MAPVALPPAAGEPLAPGAGDSVVAAVVPLGGEAAPAGEDSAPGEALPAATVSPVGGATARTRPALATTYQRPPLSTRAAGTYSVMRTRSVSGKSRSMVSSATYGKPARAVRTRAVETRKRLTPSRLRFRARRTACACAGCAPCSTM